jgi:DnaJ family protein C protein 13
MSKLLPPIFADAMAENADSAITLYEGQHENPELIWTEEIKEATSLYIMRSSRDLASQQR